MFWISKNEKFFGLVKMKMYSVKGSDLSIRLKYLGLEASAASFSQTFINNIRTMSTTSSKCLMLFSNWFQTNASIANFKQVKAGCVEAAAVTVLLQISSELARSLRNEILKF